MKETTYSVIDLLVLGIVLTEPMNAYRLAQYVDDRNLSRMVKISRPAIYKSCRRLCDDGSLLGQAMRETEAPEKVVYTITERGRNHFQAAMLHFSSRVSPFHFEFNTFIWHLPQLPFQDGLEMLTRLQHAFTEIQAWLTAHEQEAKKAGFSAYSVVKQYRMVIGCLVQWVAETRDDYIATFTPSNVV